VHVSQQPQLDTKRVGQRLTIHDAKAPVRQSFFDQPQDFP